TKDELRSNVLEHTLFDVVSALTKPATAGEEAVDPPEGEVVFSGSWEEVNEHFIAQEWSDGLPIVPPTRRRIDAFLAHTKREPKEVIGVMLPDSRAATVWNVAVNGVMAGCEPRYMPILLALAEAMVDPAYGIEHSGNTPGAETLIILNGPVIKQFGFNYTQGV